MCAVSLRYSGYTACLQTVWSPVCCYLGPDCWDLATFPDLSSYFSEYSVIITHRNDGQKYDTITRVRVNLVRHLLPSPPHVSAMQPFPLPFLLLSITSIKSSIKDSLGNRKMTQWRIILRCKDTKYILYQLRRFCKQCEKGFLQICGILRVYSSLVWVLIFSKSSRVKSP